MPLSSPRPIEPVERAFAVLESLNRLPRPCQGGVYAKSLGKMVIGFTETARLREYGTQIIVSLKKVRFKF